ncbi:MULTISPECIES: hypothetical protein [Kamptonema]|uniref:hypothetical protein n=1 Tax=Kamptonema TaxID=1501433 RepID=UPI0001DAD007|nr:MULTISPECIES: hypothetical protein [Kamptonema]CBN55129.1 conserved hypothetical protein [Kamptonema sp. PCC 6506]
MIDSNRIIGVDFDNTIVTYDDLMYKIAVEKGWISSEVSKSKKQIRDTIRQLPDGEIEWQKLQAIAYGSQMDEARLIDGVKEFFNLCKQHKIQTYIVSHKTEYANYDETQTNLRTAAIKWMGKNNFFSSIGLGLSQEQVFFASTRIGKIDKIKKLKCTDFIDDLEETFIEESFPESVNKILYAPHQQHSGKLQLKIVSRWQQINEYFFSRS